MGYWTDQYGVSGNPGKSRSWRYKRPESVQMVRFLDAEQGPVAAGDVLPCVVGRPRTLPGPDGLDDGVDRCGVVGPQRHHPRALQRAHRLAYRRPADADPRPQRALRGEPTAGSQIVGQDGLLDLPDPRLVGAASDGGYESQGRCVSSLPSRSGGCAARTEPAPVVACPSW